MVTSRRRAASIFVHHHRSAWVMATHGTSDLTLGQTLRIHRFAHFCSLKRAGANRSEQALDPQPRLPAGLYDSHNFFVLTEFTNARSLGEFAARRYNTRQASPGVGIHPRNGNGTGRGAKDRKSTRLNSSHLGISYAVFCL